MSSDALPFADRVGLWMDHRQDAEAVRLWEESQRNFDEAPEREDGAAEVLGAVLRFLADGLTCGNMPERALALLVVVRPDLVHGCTYDELAREVHSDEARLARGVAHLRNEFPGLKGGYHRTRTTAVRRALHGQWLRENLERRIVRAETERSRDKQRVKALADMREFDRRMGLA